MTFKVDDRVIETSTTTGTGAYTLDGAMTGFTTFADEIGNGVYTTYYATDDVNWEVGIGRVTTGPATLERTTVLRSSAANVAVNWGVGTREIHCALPADMAFPRALSKSIAGSGTTTLTQDEQRRDILVFTGALTGNSIVEIDATVWAYAAVINATTGDYTLTFRVTGQTGFTLARDFYYPVICDGTDARMVKPPETMTYGKLLALGFTPN